MDITIKKPIKGPIIKGGEYDEDGFSYSEIRRMNATGKLTNGKREIAYWMNVDGTCKTTKQRLHITLVVLIIEIIDGDISISGYTSMHEDEDDESIKRNMDWIRGQNAKEIATWPPKQIREFVRDTIVPRLFIIS